MMMMKGSGRESGDGEIGRTPEQPAVPGRSGAGTGGRRIWSWSAIADGGVFFRGQLFCVAMYWVKNAFADAALIVDVKGAC